MRRITFTRQQLEILEILLHKEALKQAGKIQDPVAYRAQLMIKLNKLIGA